jgi:hypothetical protein
LEEAMASFSLLHYAIVFLVVALVAAAVGFGGVAGVAMEGARLLSWRSHGWYPFLTPKKGW